jgi:FtsZ-interacting cell division protein ZipA
MTTVLLIAIVVLLLAILALLVTGWPGRERKEIEEIGRELRRELAQQRADSVQLLHAMRIELDESLRETLEQKLDSLATFGSRSPNRRKKQVSVQPQNPLHAEEEVEDGYEEDGQPSRRNGHVTKSAAVDRQLLLFAGVPEGQKSEQAAPLEIPPAKAATSFTCDIDDIPDIADLPDIED